MGTFAYMPPEVLQGTVCDARGDIYSLGVTLFELLTGNRPFDADNRVALVAAITSQRTPRACELNAKVSDDLSAVVARAMARNPLDRYQSAAELQAALRRLLDRRVKLQRRLMRATIALLAVGVGVWAYRNPEVFRSADPGTKVVAVLPFLSLAPDSVSSSVAAGITDVVGTNLAMLPISVVPASETSRFRSPDRDLDKVATELGASLMIDGSVQKYGDQLRVTLKILRSGSKALDWTHICDGSTTRVLQLQEEILGVLLQGLTGVGALNAMPNADARERLTRSPTHNEDAYADYNQARAFLDRDDIPANVPRAIALFESAVDKDPQFALAFGGLGEACFAQYRKTRDATWTQKAMQATAKACVLDPTSVGVRYSRATILLGSGKLEEAGSELQRLVREQPSHDAAHSLLGDVYDKQGRQQEAISEFQAAIRSRRAYWRHHWRLASVYLDRGQLEQAREEALRVTELQPDNPRGHQLLGTIEQADGRIDAALAAYEASLKLSPTAAAYSNIGGKFFDEKKFQIAETYYRKAVEIDPKLPVYRRNLGDVLVELGKQSESRSVYSSAVDLADSILRINPTDASTIALQGLCLAKLNEGTRALEKIAAAKRLTPSSANVLYKQTAILALLGRRSEALQALEQALAAGLPPAFAVGDPDLESMSKSPEFDRLVARYRKG
jgi:tetratricopeptide (TPR) repeat protein/TolB-like protein